MPKIILASSSLYRKELLSRIVKDFIIISPDIDESKTDKENPSIAALRLANEKAKKIALTNPEAFIIGADQTAQFKNIQINKPNNFNEAFEQLKKLSGQEVHFYSAVTLINLSKKIHTEWVEDIKVKYKKIDDETITNYLNYDKPYGCLGCIKSESLGISLLEKVSSDDPTAIIGLPLIALSSMLVKNKIKLNDAI